MEHYRNSWGHRWTRPTALEFCLVCLWDDQPHSLMPAKQVIRTFEVGLRFQYFSKILRSLAKIEILDIFKIICSLSTDCLCILIPWHPQRHCFVASLPTRYTLCYRDLRHLLAAGTGLGDWRFSCPSILWCCVQGTGVSLHSCSFFCSCPSTPSLLLWISLTSFFAINWRKLGF